MGPWKRPYSRGGGKAHGYRKNWKARSKKRPQESEFGSDRRSESVISSKRTRQSTVASEVGDEDGQDPKMVRWESKDEALSAGMVDASTVGDENSESAAAQSEKVFAV